MRAFVTGAASGIGCQIAQLFAQRGADVAGFDLMPRSESTALIEGARRSGHQRVAMYGVDICDAEALRAELRRAAEELGSPDVVFHCAGTGGFSRRFEEFPADRFEQMIRVNLIGSRNLAAAALPLMNCGGRLALVASLAGLAAAYGQAGYAASKHGVVGLASVLRVEYRPRGISVSVICPPEMDTPMARAEHRDRPPETAAMKSFAGVVALEQGCAYMIERVMRNQFLIIPGQRARCTWWMQKLLPRAWSNALADRLVARASAAAKQEVEHASRG